jgi:two-component system, cell cycle sensor histidine kinase and response regulator CckA
VTTSTDRELYRVFDRSPIGMYRSTEDGRFLYVNPALATMLGYTVDELLAINLDRDVHADPEARAAWIAGHRGRGVIDAEAQWRRRDGQLRTVRVYGHVTEDAGGVSFDASVLDVTDFAMANLELRRQREELERTTSTLQLVLRQMPALYWIVDRDLRVLRTGGAVEEVLGYSPDKFVGATMPSIHAYEPGSVDPTEQHQRAQRGEFVSYVTEYRKKQLTVTLGPYRVDGEIIGVIGTALDVTMSRALERRMVDAQRAESLGVLAGGLAHDFNNLLVAILGNADLALREIKPGTPGRASVENVRTASLRAAELTDQLLAYAGRGPLASTRVDLAPIVSELVRISAPTIPPNVGVELQIPGDLAIRGDASQIRQVVLNLLTNAREVFGDAHGTITITAQQVRHDGMPDPDDILTATTGAYVMLELADDGPGMDRETRRRIFEPFFTTKPVGHGLGLAAVLGIVRAHGGGLRVSSSLGGGARFQVLWPSTVTPLTIGTVAQPTRNVLVIDDEDLVRDVVARMIEDLGYHAVTAADGATGLAIVEAQRIDAALVDLSMPLMGGAEVIARLRRAHPAIPIVLCTGYDRDRNGPVDADGYLPKPFRIEALEQMLARLLG